MYSCTNRQVHAQCITSVQTKLAPTCLGHSVNIPLCPMSVNMFFSTTETFIVWMKDIDFFSCCQNKGRGCKSMSTELYYPGRSKQNT